MKNKIQQLIKYLLRVSASLILAKYQPRIIGITGSVGKTSTKQAVLAILTQRYRTHANSKNYNNEFGVPFTIIGCAPPLSSISRWIAVFGKVVFLLARRSSTYPELLILEMGADRPGDISRLTSLAPPDIGIITAIGEAHHEFFKSKTAIAKEKSVMVTHLPANGYAILNADDEIVQALDKKTKATVITFGFHENADVRAIEEKISYQTRSGVSHPVGMSFKICVQGASVPLLLPHVIGRPHILAALAGCAVGIAHRMNLLEITEALREFQPPCGRMRILEGIKNTTLIDDTYNSSPTATKCALQALATINVPETSSRYAVLGDMLELGTLTRDAHREIGECVLDCNVNYLVTVGQKAKEIASSASHNGFSHDKIFSFDDAHTAGRFLKSKLEPHDVVLLKGSQGIRMEKAVIELMAEPTSASELVCRQENYWD